MKIKFKRVYPDAQIPEFGHGDSTNAGLDFFCYLPDKVRVLLMPGESATIGTGVAWEPGAAVYIEERQNNLANVPRFRNMGYVGSIVHQIPGVKPAMLVRGRSGVSNQDIHVFEGTVDAGYRGEIKIHVKNTGDKCFEVLHGFRIAQCMPILIPIIEVEEVEALSESVRGDRGFGSSGN